MSTDDPPPNPPHEQSQDPFSCFGDDSSSSGDSQSSNTNDHNKSVVVTDAERGRRLLQERHKRQQNALLEHVPITDNPNFEVFKADGRRGMGLRARRSFVEGEELFREGAALRVAGRRRAASQQEAESVFAKSLQNAFDQLSPKTARAVMDLSSCDKYKEMETDNQKTLLGIYNTNSYQLGDEIDGGLFLTVARMNHSCRPNVMHAWRPDLQATLVLAARNIQEGDELCTSYGAAQSMLDTQGRRSYLRDKYAFECHCPMCLEGNESGGDDRMVELNALVETISLSMASNDPMAAIRAVDRGLLLLDQQGLGCGAFCKRILHNGYQISCTLRDKELAHSYLTQELLAVTKSEGLGCYRAIGVGRLLDNLESNNWQ